LLDGRYRVLTHLGSGGMASVLLCQDERLGRLVAVKRLHADSPADVEKRFLREARVGASLNHPNLVSVYDTAIDRDGVLIVMEYVEGEALSWTLKRGPLRPERVARIVRDLGAALEYAHEQRVVHRDVKPGNVLLRKDGVTKLVDLGIATASDLSRITSSGMVLGTAAYMAPEQLEGGETRPATDVYALAAVAYEALTGRRPRPGRTPMELAHQIATAPPPDLRELWPDAPPSAAELLERGMARDPAERPSAGELGSRLGRVLEGTTAPETPAPAPARTAPRMAAAPVERVPALGEEPRAAALEQTIGGAPATPPPGSSPRGRARGSLPQASAGKRPVVAIALALALLALAAAVVVGTVLSAGGGEGSQSAERRQQSAENGKQDKKTKKAKNAKKAKEAGRAKAKKDEQAGAAPADEPPAAEEQPPAEDPAPADESAPAAPATAVDPARGASLNDQGFALMRGGDYAGAVPVLQQAVASFPQDSQDIHYAYALYNLGKSLNRSGRPDEAIPYLEKRLTWPDQRDTVQSELDDARANAE
jgi:eukaryotic-like serine/threonine-protein kinase